MKFFKTGFCLFLFLTIVKSDAFASESIAGESAVLKKPENIIIIKSIKSDSNQRTAKLKKYLNEKNSVLADSAKTFIEAADENDLDWKLLPAIAGIESTFGKFMPQNSFNPFGWGIYKDKITRFASFEEAIETVTLIINEKYPDKLEAIARIYCPPNCYQWLNGVRFFMKEIESTSETPISLELTL